MLSAADDGPANPWATTDGRESASHPYGPLFTLTLLWRERVTVHRFRLMRIYVVVVVVALGCAIAGIAILRAAVTHRSVPVHQRVVGTRAFHSR